MKISDTIPDDSLDSQEIILTVGQIKTFFRHMDALEDALKEARAQIAVLTNKMGGD